MNTSMNNSSGSILPTVDPIPFLTYQADDLDLHLDSISALQINSKKKVEAVSFISNTQADETDIVKSVVSS